MTSSTGLQPAFDVASFINEYYDAWSGADEHRILSYYADNVVLQIPGVIMEGKEALRIPSARRNRRTTISSMDGDGRRLRSTLTFDYEETRRVHG